MTRRKSTVRKLIDAYLKKRETQRKKERRRQRQLNAELIRQQTAAERAAQQRQARRQRDVEREQRRLEQEEARRERQRERQAEQEVTRAAREAERAERSESRQAAQIEQGVQRRTAERQRRLAQEEKQRQQQTVRQRTELRHREVAAKTDAIRVRLAELERLLLDRTELPTSTVAGVAAAYEANGAAGLVEQLQEVLGRSVYPSGFTGGCRARYRPEAQELLLDYEFPRQDIVPTMVGYRYIKTADEIRPQPRKDADTKVLYRKVLARVALRNLADLFATTPAALVDTVVFNGHVSAKDRATGQPIRPCLISVMATRELMNSLVLDEPELDPVLCLAHLNAIVSPHPYDLEPVRPVLEFDLSKYKFVEEMDVVAGLDSRTDLLQLKPVEFEHLVRRLFAEIGLKSWVTQASRDDGVDAVVVNEEPVVGGLCIVQAKRYKDIVGLESVHALAGAMKHKGAPKGILVATSWYGKASHDFAREANIELIDGRNLKAMLKEHLNKDVLISLPKPPRDWSRTPER